MEQPNKLDLQLENKNIILFDGVCNLCNGFIDFVIRRDKEKKIFYSSLQSESSKPILENFGIIPGGSLYTIYYFKNGRLYDKSTAILTILKDLNTGYKIFAKFCFLFPRRLRDSMYKLISKNRYRLFGEKNTCRMPTPEEKSQFL